MENRFALLGIKVGVPGKETSVAIKGQCKDPCGNRNVLFIDCNNPGYGPGCYIVLYIVLQDSTEKNWVKWVKAIQDLCVLFIIISYEPIIISK